MKFSFKSHSLSEFLINFLVCFIVEKKLQQREDVLQWEVPLSFDPTFFPTSIYKTAFSTPKLFPTTSIQNAIQPFYFDSPTKTNTIRSVKNIPPSEPPRVPRVYGSACFPSSPVLHHCLSYGTEASNSCPAISETLNKSEQLSSTGAGKALPPIGVFWDIENCSVI